MTQNNLDFTAATIAFEIIEQNQANSKMESLINKFSGILSKDGIHALWLFLKSDEIGKNM